MPDELLDLVCGPASPLPETYQRYRLVAHLGSGGQAEVYRAVRLCGGVTSAPMTVKVFRVDPRRPLADELRSWDKGDAALMDLNNRGVQGICRRADGFYGPPPHRPGEPPQPGDAVPYQVYDYLHGVNLRDYIARGAGGRGIDGRQLNAVAALRTLAGVLRALHHPQEFAATPVLHMDVKPSNVMVLATGEVRLIDFTGARYWRPEEITQIAYTPESGGPEALQGQVGPAYDVHGFGSVVYFLVTGALPRGADASPGDHPLLADRQALREHLLAPLADNPADRPVTLELADWVDRLVVMARQAKLPAIGVDWSEPPANLVDTVRAVGRARPVLSGTETDAYQRIERLERELVALRAGDGEANGATPAANGVAAMAANGAVPASAANGAVPASAANGAATPHGAKVNGAKATNGAHRPGPVTPHPAPVGAPVAPYVAAAMPPHGAPVAASTGPKGAPVPQFAVPMPQSTGPTPTTVGEHSGPGRDGAPAARPGTPPAARPGTPPAEPSPVRGRATVVPPRPQPADESGYLPPAPTPSLFRLPTRDERKVLRRGSGWSKAAGVFAFICWAVWAISNRGHNLLTPLIAFGVVVVVAVGVFAMLRILGGLIIERWMSRDRRTARGAHLGTAVFLAASGLAYLHQTTWVMSAYNFLRGLH